MPSLTDHRHPPSRSRTQLSRWRLLSAACSIALVVLAACGDETSGGATVRTDADDAASTAQGSAAPLASVSPATASTVPSADSAASGESVTSVVSVTPAEPVAPSTASPLATEAAPTSAASDPIVATTASPVVTGDPGDPCRLLTVAEAEATLGMPVMAGVPLTSDALGYGPMYDCSYSSIDQSAGPTTVHVGVLGEGFPRDLWEQAAAAVDGVVPVEGLGDVAFFDAYGNSMDVLVDGTWVQAQLINTDEAGQLTALTEICQRAIDRI